ncbi:iron ABC transporter permease [Lentilactobacillus curieae]|uniref:Probable heme-iron transport system permease protein IsdF n=1 Tax=Lentilactobacillus curieae TaxID=1138822 RepID=A0A1S6QG95_9LACO|nr:iron ABC transporter permease [Lentilactobacillus curieae]AQW20634.1 iron ABC transporter permease [Lentilactobacillus curieae]
MDKKEGWSYSLVLMLLIITIVASVMVGASSLSFSQLIAAISGKSPDTLNTILTLRLPRIVASLICGGMLAIAGAFSQSVFRNQLADPSILGISSAGDLFVLLGSMILPSMLISKWIFAFIGGVLALLVLVNKSTLKSPSRLIIVGVALNLTLMGFIQLISGGTTFNAGGSFNGFTWNSTFMVLIVGVIGMLISLFLAPWANYLKLSDERLRTIGISTTTMRFGLLALVIYLAAGVSAVVGTIPFMGILIPNIARKMVGHDYQTLIPFSMLLGAWTLLLADTVGRIIVLPSELPAATIMTVIGGIFLVVMLQRGNFNEIR